MEVGIGKKTIRGKKERKREKPRRRDRVGALALFEGTKGRYFT